MEKKHLEIPIEMMVKFSIDISRFDCPVCRQLVCLLLIGLSYLRGSKPHLKLRHLCQTMVTQDSGKKNEQQIAF